MDAKAMEKVSKAIKTMSQAKSGVQMGEVMKAIVDAANKGETTASVNQLDDAIKKYVEGMGYKVEKSDKGAIISW